MLASAVIAGVAAGLAAGRDLGRLGALQLRWSPALFGAVALRLVAPLVGDSVILFVVSFGAIVLVALLNRSLPGMWPIALGAASNVMVVGANGAMPVDGAAITAAGASPPHDALHILMTADARLGFLADLIPVPIFRNVYSVGDIAVAIGGFWLPFAWLRRR